MSSQDLEQMLDDALSLNFFRVAVMTALRITNGHKDKAFEFVEHRMSRDHFDSTLDFVGKATR